MNQTQSAIILKKNNKYSYTYNNKKIIVYIISLFQIHVINEKIKKDLDDVYRSTRGLNNANNNSDVINNLSKIDYIKKLYYIKKNNNANNNNNNNNNNNISQKEIDDAFLLSLKPTINNMDSVDIHQRTTDNDFLLYLQTSFKSGIINKDNIDHIQANNFGRIETYGANVRLNLDGTLTHILIPDIDCFTWNEENNDVTLSNINNLKEAYPYRDDTKKMPITGNVYNLFSCKTIEEVNTEEVDIQEVNRDVHKIDIKKICEMKLDEDNVSITYTDVTSKFDLIDKSDFDNNDIVDLTKIYVCLGDITYLDTTGNFKKNMNALIPDVSYFYWKKMKELPLPEEIAKVLPSAIVSVQPTSDKLLSLEEESTAKSTVAPIVGSTEASTAKSTEASNGASTAKSTVAPIVGSTEASTVASIEASTAKPNEASTAKSTVAPTVASNGASNRASKGGSRKRRTQKKRKSRRRKLFKKLE